MDVVLWTRALRCAHFLRCCARASRHCFYRAASAAARCSYSGRTFCERGRRWRRVGSTAAAAKARVVAGGTHRPTYTAAPHPPHTAPPCPLAPYPTSHLHTSPHPTPPHTHTTHSPFHTPSLHTTHPHRTYPRRKLGRRARDRAVLCHWRRTDLDAPRHRTAPTPGVRDRAGDGARGTFLWRCKPLVLRSTDAVGWWHERMYCSLFIQH